VSQANVEIVRRVYEAVARHEGETVLALYDPKVEWDTSRGAWADLESDGVEHGHEGLRSWFRRQWAVLDAAALRE
jgi:ketosteroid isomerase-like protein